MLVVYALLLIGIGVVIAVVCLAWLFSSTSDRLTVIANMLSFGTLLLAVVAGIVALAAYSAATGLPDLKLQVRVRFTEDFGLTNKIFLHADMEKTLPVAAVSSDNVARVVVENRSSYAARTPAVSVEIVGGRIAANRYQASEQWLVTDTAGFFGKDIIALQWDGGANYAVHGNSRRSLPPLDLSGVIPWREDLPLSIRFRLFADGYSRADVTLPVSFLEARTDLPQDPIWIDEWL
jgi:hypothetical protein